ncbi:acetyltransferase [Bradyrhizobium sp. NAS96.2]|nr:acetyltransferase [Bradyrhizobium sp. NAS96.2]
MRNTKMRSYPRRVNFESGDVQFRLMGAADEAATLKFAKALAVHDMLFLPRNISERKVLSAWIKEIERGSIVSLLAVRDDAVVGCGAIVRDPMSWSAHVGEIRTVIASHVRGTGIGRALSNEAFDLALSMGLERLTVQMTSDQTRAIAIFEALGFRVEALLRDQVKDLQGKTHDIVVLGVNVSEVQKLEPNGSSGAIE